MCRDLGQQVFYGTKDNVPMSQPEISRAKAVCAACPVRSACLAEALEAGEDWGVWGGYTRPERARALEVLGYIDVAGDGELIPADVQTVVDAFESGLLDELVLL